MRNRKRTDTQINCYKFWAEFKEQSGKLLDETVYVVAKLEQAYWNTLVEEQTARWVVFVETPDAKAYLDASQALFEAKTALKKNAEDKAALAARTSAEQKMKETRPAFNVAKKQYWSDFDSWAKQAGKASGLNWEMSPDVLDRYYATFKRLASSGGGTPNVQHRLDNFSLLHRWTGGGAPLSAIQGKKSERFRIVFPHPSVYTSTTREARRARFCSAWFGLEGKSVALNVIAHRAINPSAIVKSVRLVGRKESSTLPWKLAVVITVEEPVVHVEESFDTDLTIAAIDVGWRKLGDKLRIATVFDGEKHEELLLPLRFFDTSLGEVSVERIRNVYTTRDNILERCKTALKERFPKLLEARKLTGEAFRLMRATGLKKLLFSLVDNSGDKQAIALLQAWKRDNDILQSKGILLRDRWNGRRQKVYEAFALKFAHVDALGVEDLELTEMYAVKKHEKGSEGLKRACERRGYAALGTLFQAIKNVRRRHNHETNFVTAAGSSTTCAKCEGNFVIKNGGQFGQCGCGNKDDRDYNAARNLFTQTLKALEQPAPLRKNTKKKAAAASQAQ